tara:strand:+ start:62 stop:817 length:756 start_codon:yes stop_codon:yes gene_type:complete
VTKTALITGASKRVGLSIAKHLASKGFNIAIHYNTSEIDSKKIVDELKKKKAIVERFKLDLAKTNSIKKFFTKIKNHFGTIDILVNNASVFEYDSLKSSSMNSYNKHMDINLKAPFFLSKYFHECLRNKKGNIINILDQRVVNLTPYFISYTLSKSALWTLTQSLALSLAPKIKVNAIGLGPTLKSYRQTKKQFDQQIMRTPLKKQVKLSEINNTIDLILNSESITGQLFLLDSGQNLGWANTRSKKFIED